MQNHFLNCQKKFKFTDFLEVRLFRKVRYRIIDCPNKQNSLKKCQFVQDTFYEQLLNKKILNKKIKKARITKYSI